MWFDIAKDLLVGLHDLLDLDFDEEVEGIDMLLDQSLDLQESGE